MNTAIQHPTVSSTLMTTLPQRFDMAGQRLSQELRVRPGEISAGLVKRLHAYALKSLMDSGFDAAVRGWMVEVYTMQAELPVSERGYTVRFQNEKGGYIEVVGIATSHGWPTLDFGLDIGG
jgi:hypothetical protein